MTKQPKTNAGGKIRRIRKIFRKTQQEFSEEIGVCAHHLGRMERGQVNITNEILHKIENLYGVNIMSSIKKTDKQIVEPMLNKTYNDLKELPPDAAIEILKCIRTMINLAKNKFI